MNVNIKLLHYFSCLVTSILVFFRSGYAVANFALVTLSLPVSANIGGLENITMGQISANPVANAVYVGSDEFVLSTNSSVRVEVVGEALSDGVHELPTTFYFENGMDFFETPSGAYQGAHTINVKVELASNIALQPAGNYTGSVTINVIPK